MHKPKPIRSNCSMLIKGRHHLSSEGRMSSIPLYELDIPDDILLVYGASGTARPASSSAGWPANSKAYDWNGVIIQPGYYLNESIKERPLPTQPVPQVSPHPV